MAFTDFVVFGVVADQGGLVVLDQVAGFHPNALDVETRSNFQYLRAGGKAVN